jgi:tRNA1Val (adenine37-N6)-methyltransferase
VIALMENNSSQPFIWKGISFNQDDSVLKIGTDALLLSTWIPKILHSSQHILDIGTGSGIIAILLAHAFRTAQVTGIDPEQKAVELAQSNAESFEEHRRISIVQSGLIEFSKTTDQKFDLIVSNPPFYVDHVLPSSGVMKSAKHNLHAVAAWMKGINQLLSVNGSVCLILPSSSSFEWIREANWNHLYCNRRMDVYSHNDDILPKRSLLCFTHDLVKPELAITRMYKSGKEYTSQYKEWMDL